jgi:hypothetical protein
VQHDVEVVGNHPAALPRPVDRLRQQPVVGLHLLAHLVEDRLSLPGVTTRADDEEVGVDRHRPHVQDEDVLGELLLGKAGDAACLFE